MNPERLKSIFNTFRLNDLGRIEKQYKSGGWREYAIPEVTNKYRQYITINDSFGPLAYHQVVYILSTGKAIPDGLEIDHIDGNKRNNSADNLRLVTHRENIMYSRQMRGLTA